MKQIDFRALFTVYQDEARALKGVGSWTYGATRRYYVTAFDAANAMLTDRDAVVSYIDTQYQYARMCENNGVVYGESGGIMATVIETGSLLNALKEDE